MPYLKLAMILLILILNRIDRASNLVFQHMAKNLTKYENRGKEKRKHLGNDFSVVAAKELIFMQIYEKIKISRLAFLL